MPFALPENEQIEYKPSAGFVLIDEGVYMASLFNVEAGDRPGTKPDSPAIERFLKVTYRINGGDFDGEDITDHFVALFGKGMFRIYGILDALGILHNYYRPNENPELAGRWFALPLPAELMGQSLWVQIEHEESQSRDKDTKQPKFDPATGQPEIVKFPRATTATSKNLPKPPFKKTLRPRPISTQQQAAAGGAVGGAYAGYGAPNAGYTPPGYGAAPAAGAAPGVNPGDPNLPW